MSRIVSVDLAVQLLLTVAVVIIVLVLKTVKADVVALLDVVQVAPMVCVLYLACPPRTDPDVVLALKANQHKGESYGGAGHFIGFLWIAIWRRGWDSNPRAGY